MRIIIIACVFCIFICCLQAQTRPDINDTLNVVLSLSGEIIYVLETGNYLGGVSFPAIQSNEAGDTYDEVSDSDESMRIFISYPVQPAPAGYRLEYASFAIRETMCWGNNQPFVFPAWADSIHPCMLAHVNYGDSLEYADFHPTLYGDVGILTDSWIADYVRLPVTAAYQADVDANRSYSQYMIYFHILTDYDHSPDNVEFANGNSEDYPPHLELHYVSIQPNEDDHAPARVTDLQAFPNPFSGKVTLRYTLPQGKHTARLTICNIKGQTVLSRTLTATDTCEWDGTQDGKALPNGIYTCRLTTGDSFCCKRLIMMK